MKLQKTIFFVSLLFLFFNVNAQNIVINEIITSNSTVNTDDDGSYEDWVELYNTSEASVNLLNYGLSDNDNLFKWVFPSITIEPGEHLLIWCSNKNRTNPVFPLHTNFAISAGGETITLTYPNGTIADQVPAIVIPQNFSYGRVPSGSSTFSIFALPTPGLLNANEGTSTPLNPPSFSVSSGFYSSNFTLTISHPDPEVTILYSLDGSEPKQENLAGKSYLYKNKYEELPGQQTGELLEESFSTLNYNAPIEIVDRSEVPNKLASLSSTLHQTPYYFPINPIFKGTVVRAKAVKEGFISSETVTSTYFISPEESNRYSLPVVSISIDEDAFFDYENGIYVAGKDFDDWRIENPGLIGDFNSNANYKRSGDDTEMKGNFSYFVDGNQVINQDLGIRINGGASRGLPNKSLRLYARAEYGNSSFNHSFFSNSSDSSFKTLILRNSGNDAFLTCFRDAFIQSAVSHLNFDTQAYQPTVVFLNSEYWGLLNLRERYDKHYFDRVYGIDETELDFLESNGYLIKEGDNNHYIAMLNFIANNSLSQDENYDYITTQLDPDNFIDYYTTEIYVRNTDWPGNNIEFFRKKTATYQPTAPFGQDGRWRWVLKDTDFGFGGEGGALAYTHNTLAFATQENGTEWPNPEWSTFLLRKLLENQNFRNQFINRFADLMNTTFKSQRLTGIINEMQNNLAPEINEHIERWNHIGSLQQWNTNVSIMSQFANERSFYQRNHIREKFGISENINTYLYVSNPEHGHIKINTIEILPTTPGVQENPYPWTGIYFESIPLKLTAIASPGYTFSHWSGASNSTEEQIIITPSTDFSIQAHFIEGGVTPQSETIYFWLMDNNIVNDTPLQSIEATFEESGTASLVFNSCLVGYPFASGHPSWRKASMERRNSPTELNYRPEANDNIPFANVSMRAIQVKQPFQNNGFENNMQFNFSTVGYKSIKFAFAAKDEGAADAIIVEYALNYSSPVWIALDTFSIGANYALFESDLTGILAANNNPNLAIRLRFSGTNMTADDGNRVTFNNISVEGVQDDLTIEQPQLQDIYMYPNPFEDHVYLSNSNDIYEFKLYSIDGKLIKTGAIKDGKLNLQQLSKGIYLIQLQNNDFTKTIKLVKK